MPRSAKRRPETAKRSTTVLHTSTSPGSASAATPPPMSTTTPCGGGDRTPAANGPGWSIEDGEHTPVLGDTHRAAPEARRLVDHGTSHAVERGRRRGLAC